MLNVEALNDTVQSQLCLYGNRKVFVLPAIEQEFTLSVNGTHILDCQSYDDACINESSLELLAQRIESLDDSALIESSITLNKPCKIGFKTEDDGFVEVISSDELVQDVEIQGE